MKNEAWSREIDVVLDLLGKKQFEVCLEKLNKLHEVVANEVYEKGSLSTWHEEQVLGLKSLILEESGQFREAITTRIELSDTHFERAKGHCESAGFSYAVAALLSFKLGDEDKACELAEKAIQLSGLAVSMPTVVLEAASMLEEVRERQAREEHRLF